MSLPCDDGKKAPGHIGPGCGWPGCEHCDPIKEDKRMPDENTEWALEFCPQMNEGLHEPRAVRILPQASPMQTEVELEVVCRLCGATGLACLVLSPEGVVGHTPAPPPTIKVAEGASCTPSSGFWYSLFDGGYVDPDELLEEGAEEVNEAVDVLRAFRSALEAADAIEEM